MFNHISNPKIKLLLTKVHQHYTYDVVHSKDCDNLAYEISKKCGETISGSTLKRLFGFIKTKSLPNKYTLNLLARYAGYNDYNSFCATEFLVIDTPKNTEVIDYITTKLYKNNVLFTYTNGWHKLSSFLNSNYKATAIIGEGGTGKSAFIASFLNTTPDEHTNIKIIYRLSAKNIIPYLDTINLDTQLLIVDDIEETTYNFVELRNSLIAILKLLVTFKKLKLILSIRPYTWIKLIELLDTQNEKDNWMNVNFNSIDPISVCNINTFIEPKEHTSSVESLQTPFFKSLVNDVDEEVINDWVLLREFFDKKIKITAYAYEKQSFLNHILEHTNLGVDGNRIKREKIQYLIVKHKKAYIDLVSFNIITEHKETNKYGSFVSYYSFGKSIYFEFQILAQLLEQFDGFNPKLVQHIVANYEYEKRLGLLKLATSFALYYLDKNVANLFDIELEEYERQALMIHIAQQIRENKLLQNKILPLFTHSKTGRTFFIERWIDDQNLNGFYGKMIQQYLTIVSSNQDLLFGNALLYYSAYLNQDVKACETYYTSIIHIPDTKTYIHPFVIGRKYMTLLLEEHRLNKSFSNTTIKKIESYINANLKELESDLPVHFSGFEYNILHAEFLCNHYYFTPQILKKLVDFKSLKLHKNDIEDYLLGIFIESYNRSQKLPPNEIQYQLNQIHAWYRVTLLNYLDRLNNQ